jgi:putative lipoic acid-binding regulatory protein
VDLGPSIDLLASTHTFPGKYVFKAIGLIDDNFTGRVVAVVRAELDQTFDAPYETRGTPNGRHIAVTIEPWVESPEQVLAIYRRLKAEAGVVILF